MKITSRAMVRADWYVAFAYGGEAPFEVFVSDAVPGMSITRSRIGGKRQTVYTAKGFRTNSLNEAIRSYNNA